MKYSTGSNGVAVRIGGKDKMFNDLAAAEKWYTKTKARLEKLAGKPLSDDDIAAAPIDPRTSDDRASAPYFEFIVDGTIPVEPELHYTERDLKEAQLAYREKQVGRDLARAEQVVRERNAKLEANQRKALYETDARKAARTAVDNLRLQVQFSNLTTPQDYSAIEALEQQAEGDLTVFADRRKAIMQSYNDRLDAKKQKIESDLQTIRENYSALEADGTWARLVNSDQEVHSISGEKRTVTE